jgi:cobalt-zinc-cadmium efflux system protein
MGANCQHHPRLTGRILIASSVATTLFVAVELFTGVWSGSLALISDAGHNFTDALALLLALFGTWLQSRPADEYKTFGYHRGGVLAAFVNAIALLGLSVWILWESYQRLLNPQPVAENMMIIIAGLGIVLNVGILVALRYTNTEDLNIRAASLHMLGDALGSVAIIAGAVLIQYTGWLAIDPILSALIAALIIWSALGITRESLNILLEGTPKGVSSKQVWEAVASVEGVLDVHDLHVWSLGSHAHALSCHVLIEDMPPSASDAILCAINQELDKRFHIHHTTIQFEHVPCSIGGNGCRMHDTLAHHHHSHHHNH